MGLNPRGYPQRYRYGCGLFAVTLFLISFQSDAFASNRREHRTDRTAYVHLFEWTWKDVAQECETFLGPKGFAAVQVSPPNEHAVLPNYPWYQRYQPVSYQLTSRSGTREEFIDMVKRCRAAGVDVYADAVINHMSWVNRSGTPKSGSAGTQYGEYSYGTLFSPADFHRCGKNGDDSIQNYQDRWEVQNCNLATCADLKTESTHVRSVLSDYLNDLLEIGVAGFRIDAAKHIAPDDLSAILGRARLPYYAYQEVIDFGTEPIHSEEYYATGDVTDFRYPRELARVIKQGSMTWLQSFGDSWGFVRNKKAVVFVDNHDIQRGHGGGGDVITHKDPENYILANVFMLAWPFGYPQVMSSYRFSNPDQGPPSNSSGQTKRVYSNGQANCGNEWICEHRWAPIANMVAFRNYTQSAPNVTNWWSNGGNLIAFGRGNRGFVVINNETAPADRWFNTGMPAGTYCDIISGEATVRGRSQCSGDSVTVNDNGWAQIRVGAKRAVAIYGGARTNGR